VKRARLSLPISLLAALICSPSLFAGSLDLPTVEISVTGLAFGNQVIDSRSQPKTVLLLNRGSGPLAIRKISASGDFAAESDCGTSLDAGHGCTIVTRFSPSLSGDADGTLTIEDDSKSSPHVVNLSGVGVLPLTITPTVLHFNPGTVGMTQMASVTLTNNQSDSIHAVQITTGAGFTQNNTCSLGIAPGKSCEVQITFRPTEARQIRGKVTVSYGTNAQMLVVEGSGVAAVPDVRRLQVATAAVPAVIGKAPVIPPAPAVPSTLASARPASHMTSSPEIITPPPNVSSALPSSARRAANATPAVIQPPPTTSGALARRSPTRSPSSGNPSVIPPPPAISGKVSSVRPLVNGTPGVISPPPSTATLPMMASNAPPTLGSAPERPPIELPRQAPVAAPRTESISAERQPLPAPAPVEKTPLLATAKPPAETSAVRRTNTPAAAQSDSAPSTIPLPVTQSAPTQPLPKETAHPETLAATIPPPRRAMLDGPRVTLTVGLKGTAGGTVTSSTGAINCGGACQDDFVTGEKVVLVPQPEANSSFAGWRGCDRVAGTRCTVLMDHNKSVTAIFVRHYDDLSPE